MAVEWLMPGVVKLEAGERVELWYYPGAPRVELFHPCEVKDNGAWCCLTHQVVLEGFESVESHRRSAKGKAPCRVFWHCRVHGPEQA